MQRFDQQLIAIWRAFRQVFVTILRRITLWPSAPETQIDSVDVELFDTLRWIAAAERRERNCQELPIENLVSGSDVLLGGLGVGLVGGPFLVFPVDEDGPSSNEWDEVWCVDFAPPVLSGVEEFVGHRQRRKA